MIAVASFGYRQGPPPDPRLSRPSSLSFLMFFFFISCVSFVLFFSKSLSLPPLPPWACDARLLSLPVSRELPAFLRFVAAMARRRIPFPSAEEAASTAQMSILDLPELTTEIILGKLSPAGLWSMAAVCNSMRERCRSDRLWRRHLEEKWGSLMGSPAAQRAWKAFLSSSGGGDGLLAGVGVAGGRRRRWLRSLPCLWLLSWLTSKLDSATETRPWLPDNSIMSWYLAIETGCFRFPAQVFNRENGHLGFMLSCYDAELSYDSGTDSFTAMYPPHGRRTMVIEEGVPWERLRAPPVETSPHSLHVSDCLADLRPGDHVEVQWRRNKEFPYGWWYGVAGHLSSCDGIDLHCRCRSSDAVVLEFNQYTAGSRWRRAILNRKSHREEGNEVDGFYGGVRKLCRNDEIAAWRRLWPTDVLD